LEWSIRGDVSRKTGKRKTSWMKEDGGEKLNGGWKGGKRMYAARKRDILR
jgi:hypothetical protein